MGDGAQVIATDSPKPRVCEPATRRPGQTAQAAERRAHRRLEIRLPVELRRLGEVDGAIVRSITTNISTGGMYLELDRPDFAPGDRMSVQLTIPPAEGVCPYAGEATCEAEVLRCSRLTPRSAIARYGLAARFLYRLRITY